MQMPSVVNAAILVSAWSAAASDIYISSRFLFFLARRGHAPAFLAHLLRYPKDRRIRSHQSESDNEDESEGLVAHVNELSAYVQTTYHDGASKGLIAKLGELTECASSFIAWVP